MIPIIAAVCLVAAHAWAGSCDATGCTWTATYTEPSLMVTVPPATTGLPLTDLKRTDLYMQADALPGQAQPAVQVVTTAASNPGGGGTITVTTPKAAILPGQVVTVRFWVNATNGAGVSANAGAVLTKDRSAEVVPQLPTGLTIR